MAMHGLTRSRSNFTKKQMEILLSVKNFQNNKLQKKYRKLVLQGIGVFWTLHSVLIFGYFLKKIFVRGQRPNLAITKSICYEVCSRVWIGVQSIRKKGKIRKKSQIHIFVY
jgi:uncharacterized membrane-anchored protein